MGLNNLTQLYRAGELTEMDLHFARLVSTLAANDDADVSLAAALVSNACGKGNICFDLSSVSGRTILEEKSGQEAVSCPPIERWRSKLESSSVVGRPGHKLPLILDNKDRLYLYRYWDYEKKLTDAIKQRIHQQTAGIDFNLLKKGLTKLFPEESDGGINWQKVASLTALLKKFCVISGGPGTGKTTTVAKILALLVEQFNSPGFRILLAAPTGKAAARVAESIKNAKDQLNCSQTVKNAIPQEALTIHRMLGTKRESPYFRFNRDNRLPVEVVVVDEASMVDLALMSKLAQALPDTAKLVLIGDKDQLASVEAGAVLGDICDRNNVHGFSAAYCQQILELSGENVGDAIEHCKPNPGLHDCIVNLTGSYRFGEKSGIGELSGSVNRGDLKTVRALFKNNRQNTISLKAVMSQDDFYHFMTGEIITGYTEYLKANDPHQALKLFTRFKVLCALRVGPFGAGAVNRLVEKILAEKNLIRKDRLYDNPWYKGRPVLITSNDYNLGLFNGDIGITLPDHGSDRGEIYVYFPGSEGESRRFSPYILPEHETVYAMTVHKSQGSEFDNVLLILPDRESPVLTRELLYTAITRARKAITVLGTQNIVESAVSRKTERKSGLRDALWEG